ncbi:MULTISPECIES: adenylate kinase family protein [Haloferax]|uniref:adenylate kinase family protein n=1 Tax=Haloferax TaxID=2251 RepID=UPI000E224E53|nr:MULTISPECIES: adenylate kinase family protein [Haloferax]RDZ37735.1 adenylate kinase [Haloferax sp. Atlit-24N]RLM38531.1 adenylate kinase [Haloferax sp. Atlit-109R]RLM46476.1 adenylate kinase [Haloferax sp. Atlit-105R]WEL29387.1 Adenylate kinase [Haloferax alexandrinus]
MRVVVTGTPGTGKTTATERVAADLDLDVVHLNRLVKDEGLWTERDDERDTLVVDLDAARDELGDWDGIVESHLAHHFEADRVVVLRCRPDVLEQRLLDRGEAEAKARENRESEALDVILGEAVEFHGEESVYEIDTTERDPDAVADDIAAVIAGERAPSAGTVDFIDYL